MPVEGEGGARGQRPHDEGAQVVAGEYAYEAAAEVLGEGAQGAPPIPFEVLFGEEAGEIGARGGSVVANGRLLGNRRMAQRTQAQGGHGKEEDRTITMKTQDSLPPGVAKKATALSLHDK